MSIETVNQWLEPLGRLIGQSLQLNEEGALGIELNSGALCTIEFDSGSEHLHLHSVVASVAPSDTAKTLLRAMKENLYGIGTSGYNLGFDDARGELVLGYQRPISMLNEEIFLLELESFAATCDSLRQTFQSKN